MNNEEFLEESFCENDLKVKELLEKIEKEDSRTKLKEYIETLDTYLFDKFCLKDYLKSCEPEMCVYRLMNECKYVKLSQYLYQNKKISLSSRSYND